jgi:hypothetical protein
MREFSFCAILLFPPAIVGRRVEHLVLCAKKLFVSELLIFQLQILSDSELWIFQFRISSCCTEDSSSDSWSAPKAESTFSGYNRHQAHLHLLCRVLHGVIHSLVYCRQKLFSQLFIHSLYLINFILQHFVLVEETKVVKFQLTGGRQLFWSILTLP